METTIGVLRDASLAAFLLLAAVAIRLRIRHGPGPTTWAAVTFATLAVVSVTGRVLPDGPPDDALQRSISVALITAIIVFPYLLFRFTAAFRPAARWMEWLTGSLTILIILPSAAAIAFVPRLPGPDDPRPAWAAALLLGILIQWTTCSAIAAGRLWRAGSGRPAAPLLRMRLLAVGSIGLNLAIVFSFFGSPRDPTGVDLAGQLLVLTSAGMFFVGFSPPQWLRQAVRAREERAMLNAAADLLASTTPGEISERILPYAARLIGSSHAALADRTGAIVSTHDITPERAREALLADDGSTLRVELKRGIILVWLDPHMPVFGQDDIEALRALGGLADLALERAAAFDRERQFISNAAHELRTPLAALTGLAVTLANAAGRLTEEQTAEVLAAMERQGERATDLVERMLDLAYIEHTGVRMEPVDVAEVARRAVDASLPPEGAEVSFDITPGLRALAETGRLEQVMTNLITNAFRHGGRRVTVSARDGNGGVIVSVSDDGPGVSSEVAPSMFEPFTRSADAMSTGTGLGLAISRRLVEAFGGSIHHEPVTPHGARFEVRLRGAA